MLQGALSGCVGPWYEVLGSYAQVCADGDGQAPTVHLETVETGTIYRNEPKGIADLSGKGWCSGNYTRHTAQGSPQGVKPTVVPIKNKTIRNKTG